MHVNSKAEASNGGLILKSSRTLLINPILMLTKYQLVLRAHKPLATDQHYLKV